jgi:hypothetical protein
VGAGLTLVAVVVGAELVLFGDQLGHNLDVLFAGQRRQVPAGRAPRLPAALPVLAPPAGGPVTQIEVRPLDPCRAGHTCNVLVQLTLRPQPEPLHVVWGFEIVDRCRETRRHHPGGTASVPPGRDRLVATASLEVPPGRSLAVIPVTRDPVPVAGRPMRLPGEPGRC